MTQYGQILRYSIVVLLSIIRSSHQTVYTCTASASCGCSTNSATVGRIVGGETASSATWSWTVSISIAGSSLCGGSIISSSWIITAAHCVNNRIPSQITIYAGSITRLSGTQIRSVSKIVVHSSYSSTTYVNDIALLKLASPLIMTDPYVSAICLPSVSQVTLSAGEWPPVGTNVIAVGWGRLRENGSSPSILQQVTVQTIDYQASTCTPTMVDWHVQFCAGVSGGGKDTCQGDSGGPLMMFSSNNQWVLVGVTSNGVGCAQATHSAVCGCSFNTVSMIRIVGEENASEASWGWAVSISINETFLCGGSILSRSQIIIAAHCVEDFTASQFIIYVGSILLWLSTQNRSVSQIIAHPNYDSVTYTNDIALLRLASLLVMNDPNVSLICVPSINSAILASSEFSTNGITVQC
ncbi:unnamed protein product [Rotaria sordida]|uniref:Peptidase S1 domain-containing protein n=1 Tax=Rotaria sordida TaxID=392033 RepID=A0A818UI05_9BILA|nr:unnamed protein product [Rotaria sordida]